MGEIEYDMNGPHTKVCPCCGESTKDVHGYYCVYACMDCFAREKDLQVACTVMNIADARAQLYQRGIELRAAGKLPALKKVEQEWGVWVHLGATGDWANVRSLTLARAEELAQKMNADYPSLYYEVRPYPSASKVLPITGTPGAPGFDANGRAVQPPIDQHDFNTIDGLCACCSMTRETWIASGRAEVGAMSVPNFTIMHKDPEVITITGRVFTESGLARLLAECDPALVAVVDRVSEGNAERREANIAKAVARDEAGAATRAKEVAAAVFARLAWKP